MFDRSHGSELCHDFDRFWHVSQLHGKLGRAGDLLATRQKWNEAGLLTRDEMQTNCCYATQDKTWVRDPDGNEWEVFVVLEDNLPETPAAAGCCGTDGTCATPLTQID